MNTTWIKENWLALVAIVLALGALTPTLPFAYYQIMNWVVAGAALMGAYSAYKGSRTVMQWILIASAVVFNPVAPLYFSTQVWQVADAIVVLVLASSFYFNRNK